MYYANTKEQDQKEAMFFADYNLYKVQDFTVTSRPVRKVFLNFDKDLAARMFGFRVKFDHDKMREIGEKDDFDQKQLDFIHEDQTFKPVHFFARDRCQAVVQRYQRLTGFHSKQTICKVLDSDDEEDMKEIEKNRKMAKVKNLP